MDEVLVLINKKTYKERKITITRKMSKELSAQIKKGAKKIRITDKDLFLCLDIDDYCLMHNTEPAETRVKVSFVEPDYLKKGGK